jgi:hypothetical protein
MKTLVIKTTVLSTAVALIASVALAAPMTKAPAAKRMTDQQLDAVVGGWVNGEPCNLVACGDNGWGNGTDPINPGSDNGATAPSKLANLSVPAAGKINTNPTTSTGR